MKHPIQPLEKDEHGVIRFKENPIIRLLLEDGSYDLNRLAILNFSVEDRQQLAQLLGYSLAGYGELSYVTEEDYQRAEAEAKRCGL